MRIEITVDLGKEKEMRQTKWLVSVDNGGTFKRFYEGHAGYPEREGKNETLEKAIREGCELAITAMKLEQYLK